MKNILSLFNNEIKKFETLEMLHLFIFSIISCLIDWFMIRNYISNAYLLNFVRSVYISIGILSYIYLTNRFFRFFRIKFEKQKQKTKKEAKIIDSLRNLSGHAHNIMYEISNGIININLDSHDKLCAAETLTKMYSFAKIQGNEFFIDNDYLYLIEKAFYRYR